jgi:hypothetical protein
MSFQDSGRITHYGNTWRNVSCNYRAHAYRRTSTYGDRTLGSPVAQDRAASNKGVITDMHVPVTLNTRCKGDVVTNDAVVFNVRVKISMKESAYGDIRTDRDKSREQYASVNCGRIEKNRIVRYYWKWGCALADAAIGNPLAQA